MAKMIQITSCKKPHTKWYLLILCAVPERVVLKHAVAKASITWKKPFWRYFSKFRRFAVPAGDTWGRQGYKLCYMKYFIILPTWCPKWGGHPKRNSCSWQIICIQNQNCTESPAWIVIICPTWIWNNLENVTRLLNLSWLEQTKVQTTKGSAHTDVRVDTCYIRNALTW